jgi:hypothetical protein
MLEDEWIENEDVGIKVVVELEDVVVVVVVAEVAKE